MTSPPDNPKDFPADHGDIDSISAIIDLFKRDVDRTLLQSRLPMSVDERLVDLRRSQSLVREFDHARTTQPRPMTDLPHMLRLRSPPRTPPRPPTRPPPRTPPRPLPST